MSYQRIQTPRAYICNVQYLMSMGKISSSDITTDGSLNYASGSSVIQLFDMKPSNVQTITANGLTAQERIQIDTTLTTNSIQDANFCAILGHNFKEADAKFKLQVDGDPAWGSPTDVTMTEVVNCNVTSGWSQPNNNGWSLFTFSATSDNEHIRIVLDDVATYDADIKIGAILIGEYLDFPHAPDLSISKKLLFDGVKKQQSIGGQTYATSSFLMPANWGNYNQWENKSTSTLNKWAKSGRTQLDMNFSFMNDTDVFPEQMNNRTYLASGNDIASNLVMRTQGGMFPFIFQFDNGTATDADSFMWCRLNGEPTFSQVAHQTWNCDISLIEEF